MASAQKHRVFQLRLVENIATNLLIIIENVLRLVENSLRTSPHRARSMRISLGASTLHTSPQNHRPISVTSLWNSSRHDLSLWTDGAFCGEWHCPQDSQRLASQRTVMEGITSFSMIVSR